MDMTRRDRDLTDALERHGFGWDRDSDGGLVALVPWVHATTGATGVDREPVRDMRECARVLGY